MVSFGIVQTHNRIGIKSREYHLRVNVLNELNVGLKAVAEVVELADTLD